MFASLNNNMNIQNFVLVCLIFMASKAHCQDFKGENYTRFIDSANVHINESSARAQAFLDSIPPPLEKSIAGKLADCYSIKALIHDDYSENTYLYQSYILALKYAEKEKNYRIAGFACLELYSNIYFTKKDTTANEYLEKAKTFYKLANYNYGAVEIEQMLAYTKFMNGEYKQCNAQLLSNLEKYNNIKDVRYFYMFATYMLTLNYLQLDDFKKAQLYYKAFKTVKDDESIVKYNYLSFKSAIDLSFAEAYFEKKQIDSTNYYLANTTKLRNYMNNELIRDYFSLKADAFKFIGNLDKTRIYLDSISFFENKMFNTIVDASMDINAPLLKAESELETENDKKFRNGALALLLFFMLAALGIFYLIYRKKNRHKLSDCSNRVNNLAYLKSNNEKLTGKVIGLEEYINNLKKEIKDIATIHDLPTQREKIKRLYRSLQVNSSTLLDKSENHLELINNLNVEFFRQMKLRHPQLNDSEVITACYLFMGFKNKEIAVFLNISVRAMESRRYRISKKINLGTKQTTLVDYLKTTFKDLRVR